MFYGIDGKVRGKPLKNFILSDPYLCQSQHPPKIVLYDIIKVAQTSRAREETFNLISRGK
jgi:hypothetical protein